eukprot:6181635-Pleurochrysis_carterae.AAC.2
MRTETRNACASYSLSFRKRCEEEDITMRVGEESKGIDSLRVISQIVFLNRHEVEIQGAEGRQGIAPTLS